MHVKVIRQCFKLGILTSFEEIDSSISLLNCINHLIVHTISKAPYHPVVASFLQAMNSCFSKETHGLHRSPEKQFKSINIHVFTQPYNYTKALIKLGKTIISFFKIEWFLFEKKFRSFHTCMLCAKVSWLKLVQCFWRRF